MHGAKGVRSSSRASAWKACSIPLESDVSSNLHVRGCQCVEVAGSFEALILLWSEGFGGG